MDVQYITASHTQTECIMENKIRLKVRSVGEMGLNYCDICNYAESLVVERELVNAAFEMECTQCTHKQRKQNIHSLF